MINIDSESKNMTIIRKDTASFTLSLNNYKLQNGDKVIFTLASSLESPKPLLQKEINKFNDGAAEIFLSTDDTNIEVGKYFYDIHVELSNGQVDTVIGPARFVVEGGVTY